MSRKILFVYGTRPEAIKLAPLIHEFRAHPVEFTVEVCLTGQHRSMLDQVNEFFGIASTYDLNVMAKDQSLSEITARCLRGLQEVLVRSSPDLVMVQGDTTTAMSGALAAFYLKIPVAHVEAGLRSGEKYSPFPEEINRRIASLIAEYHFAPTPLAAENLARESIRDNVFTVGNTVIDALHWGLRRIQESGEAEFERFFDYVPFDKKVVLVTGHRRESFGDGFENICHAIKEICAGKEKVCIVYPVHMNPKVREPVNRILAGVRNVHLIEPLDYPHLIWLMNRSYLVLTDSGGIQEEAPALGKPVLVMREVTERQEGIEAGTARLVGTSKAAIVRHCNSLLSDSAEYEKMARAVNPYGDGKTSQRICTIIRENLRR